jgi:hypothetical protein
LQLDSSINGGRSIVTPHALDLLKALNPGDAQPAIEASLAAFTCKSSGGAGPASPSGPAYQQLLRLLHSNQLDVQLPDSTPIRLIKEGARQRPPKQPFAAACIEGLCPEHIHTDLPLHGSIRMLEHMVQQVVAHAACEEGRISIWNKVFSKLSNFK